MLAERFAREAAEGSLEDLLLAKEAEVVRLQQEVSALRVEKEQLELALEAAGRQMEDLTKAPKGRAPEPDKKVQVVLGARLAEEVRSKPSTGWAMARLESYLCQKTNN